MLCYIFNFCINNFDIIKIVSVFLYFLKFFVFEKKLKKVKIVLKLVVNSVCRWNYMYFGREIKEIKKCCKNVIVVLIYLCILIWVILFVMGI